MRHTIATYVNRPHPSNMESISNIAKAVWGENNQNKEEPISGVKGDTAKGEPYDAGNMGMRPLFFSDATIHTIPYNLAGQTELTTTLSPGP